MEIIVAKNAGFCVGVERSVELATAALKPDKEVYILGALVHNKQVIEKLQEKGIHVIDKLDDIKNPVKATVIISAHGVPPSVYEELKVRRIEYVDTTCPPVLKVHRLAQNLIREGYTVVIIGDKGHTEVKGILGWSGNSAYVVERENDILNIPYSHKIGVLAQTTQAKERFDYLCDKLKSKAKELVKYNTICDATRKRQEEILDLSKDVDVMLVIGDPSSANTKRLVDLATNIGVETHRIGTVDDLDMNWIYGKKKIGISAGASTPSWVIKGVVDKLSAPK